MCSIQAIRENLKPSLILETCALSKGCLIYTFKCLKNLKFDSTCWVHYDKK